MSQHCLLNKCTVPQEVILSRSNETVSNFFISARYCDNQLKSSDRMINSVGAYGSRTQKSVLTIGCSHDGGFRHRFGVHLGYSTAFMLQVSCSEIRKKHVNKLC